MEDRPGSLLCKQSANMSEFSRGEDLSYTNVQNGDITEEDHMPDQLSPEARETRPNDVRMEGTTYQIIRKKLNGFRLLCGAVVNHEQVQLVMVLMIAINALMMGIGTFDFVTENKSVDSAFERVDWVFLVIFTIELALQLIYHGLKLFLDGWLIFDFAIILVSWSFSSLQIIRAFRIFRSLRLVTRITVMRNLVLAVFSVMPKLAAICLLLGLISYIFAVMMTQLFKDLFDQGVTDQDYFGRLDNTFFTLFQMMTLDGWGDIARQVIKVYPWAWVPFITFVSVSGFVIVNLIIAVICDAVSSLHKDVKSKLNGTFDEDEGYSLGTPQANIREQCECIEGQVDELQRVQEHTMHTLEYLIRNLQARNNERSQE